MRRVRSLFLVTFLTLAVIFSTNSQFSILNSQFTAQAAEAEYATCSLIELKLSKQVVQAGETQEIRAVVSGKAAELPETITILFRDISDAKYLDQKLEVNLQRTDASTSGRGVYQGQVSFPEKISRTKALTAISWRYTSGTQGERTQAVENISGAWFFVPIKAADSGYVATPTLLNFTPVSGYSLRQPKLSSFTEIAAAVQENGSVLITAYGKNVTAEDLSMVWTNGNNNESVRLTHSDEVSNRWQGVLYPVTPQTGRYRLTSITAIDSGERLRNYPDTYFTLQQIRSNKPEVKLESVVVSAIPYRLQGNALLSGELGNISRVWFYWSFISGDGKGNSSALTEAERSANMWVSTYKPTTGNANSGLWSITGVRVDFRDGWQVMFADDFGDDEDIEDWQRMSNSVGLNSGVRPVDLPELSHSQAAGDGHLLYFTFTAFDEVWTWGDIWLEFEQRSEAWVYDAATRQIIVYHPYTDNGYYIRVHETNETSVKNVFLYYPGG